jgi:hypothetical protein
MDMAARSHEQQVFFSTGRRQGEGVDAIDDLGLRPALFAHYRDLTRLRYDFPLVLVRSEKAVGPVRALSDIVDEVLREVAPKGMAGERLRRHALRLEREIRARSADGERGLLSDLWPAAAKAVGGPSDENGEEMLRYTAAALKLDGEVISCDARMPVAFLTHAWEDANAAKAREFRKTVDALMVRLSDILRAAYIHSEAGQQPSALRASVGSAGDDEFDFKVMSRLVARRAPKDELPAARRKRIEWALSIMRTQRFHPDPKADPKSGAGEPFDFRFTDCASAAKAFRERLPDLVETVKAIAVAELEAQGRYMDVDHDAFFEGYGDHSLTPDDLALFPDYLVCIPPERNAASENANLMEMLSSGLPVKVLVETGDLLEEAAIGAGHFAFGVRSTRLAMTATGLGGVFVLQAPSSNLYALRTRISAGLAHRGPALFSVFTGVAEPAAELPPYLTSAAAMQARACPTFTYDPHAGDNQAARFSFENNPQAEADWPAEKFEYADEQMQTIGEQIAFTFADFVLCDRRYAGHFARVPRDRWNAGMLPVAEWLDLGEKQAAETVPYLLAVDANDLLHRVIVDARLMQAVRRNRVLWHRLQEQGGIHNSYAARALAKEKTLWEEEKRRELEAAKGAAAAAPKPAVEPGAAAPATDATAPSAPAAAAVVEEARPSDDPWIETARCPSCNECYVINDRMFAYNENKQAYIKDPDAGTFRQLVEAAESCQVAIIHPGKPRNPKEPGLEELIKRAEPFQ